ncbi:MAG TPA: hypothetical protein VE977_06460, partial [Pyrinomonadaceae bacterium]|nr:hypothetical protein [Pyrinomonadaceae bacterium]
IRNEYADISRLINTRNVNWVELSNILTVSIVLVTRDNWTLLGQRTSRVDNASLVVAASAAENIHRWLDEPSVVGDFWSPARWLVEDDRARRVQAGTDDKVDYQYEPATCPNPFYTVLRGINEEVGKEVQQAVSLKDITLLCVAWDMKGFNPHIYALVRVDLPLSDVRRIVSASRGTDNWEANLLPVPFEPGGLLERYLADEEWAEISKGAVLRALVHKYGFNEVDRAFR